MKGFVLDLLYCNKLYYTNVFINNVLAHYLFCNTSSNEVCRNFELAYHLFCIIVLHLTSVSSVDSLDPVVNHRAASLLMVQDHFL